MKSTNITPATSRQPRRTAANNTNSSNSVRESSRHGLVLANENIEEYDQLRDSYVARFGPRDLVEIDLVDRMVHAVWRRKRVWTMMNEIPKVRRLPLEAGIKEHLRLSNDYHRALKTLLWIRKNVPLAIEQQRAPDCGVQ